jgi:endonuclease/exonuclease/phosphatase family metal-dependent hydrolase
VTRGTTGRRALFWAVAAILAVPAVTLTVVRLTEPQRAWLIKLESLTPLALVPYALLLVWLAGWALPHRRRAWVLVVPLAGLAMHVWWLSPLYVGPNPPPSAAARPLVVMTGNLDLGRADGTAVVAAATAARVDVLVLEEVTPGELATMNRAGLSELLPHHAGSAAPDDVGTMVFSRDRLGHAGPLPAVARSWQVTVQAPDGPVLLFAVHGHTPNDPAAWHRTLDTIDALAVEEHPGLVVGDFDATLDQRPMRRLATDGFRSVTELANEGWQPTWPSNGLFHVFGLPLPMLVQIDHVLVGSRMAAMSSHTVAIPGTDHRALVATVAAK